MSGAPHSAKYVLIGNSAGAVGAIEAIRQHDKQGSIVAISDEGHPPYSRPLIADFLSGHRSIEQIYYRNSEFYTKKDVQPVLDATVEKIDLEKRTVHFTDRKSASGPITYEKLLLATGGVPFVPPMEGIDKKNIFTFVTLKDAVAIKNKIDSVNKVLVIGGGLIGMCVSEALVKLGKRVTVVELLDRVLNINLDKSSSQLYQERLDSRGIRLITKDSVTKFMGKPNDQDRVGGGVLKSGTIIDCDMAIVAIGVRPRLELVKGTPIKVNRGIVVDRHMETSVPNVYACGDVSEAYDFIWDQNRMSPIWPNAYLGGRNAGLNMAGKMTEYPGSTGMTSFAYFDLPVVSAGMNTLPVEEAKGAHEMTDEECRRYEEVIKIAKDGFYRKLILYDGRIKGFIMLKDITGAGILTDLMRDKVDVCKFKTELMSEDLGIGHLPKEMLPDRLRGEH